VSDERPAVMILDADPESLASHYRLLSNRGYRVATYSSAYPACRYASEERPDAVVILTGPSLGDGLDVVRRMKEASPRSHVLLVAGSGVRPSIGEAARSGAEEHLAGTLGTEGLLSHLEEALGERPVTSAG